MAVALRLMRMGRRGKAYYRIIAVDKRAKRTGSFIENLGSYNPLQDPAEIKINQQRFDYWVQKGAQLSEGLYKLMKYKKKLKARS